MTLADLIRQYLEDRRKYYARKNCTLRENTCNLSIRDDTNDGLVTIDNKQYFSNNIDPKKDRFAGSRQTASTHQIGVSKSRRIINLPDGSVKIETIIRDTNGNEEKHITTRKGDKQHTVIIRKDGSGIERREEKLTDINDSEEFGFNSPSSLPGSDAQNDINNGNDIWFHKFFKPQNSQTSEHASRHENFPFDFNGNTDEQIEKILKKFTRGQFFDSFSDVFKNNDLPKDKDSLGEIPDSDDFSKMYSSLLNEETRKLIENFEKQASISPKSFTSKKYVFPKQRERLYKKITPPPPSLFEQFLENAMIEIPEEKTALDQFIKLDEDQINSVQTIQRERDQAIKKLDKYFSSILDTRAKDVYSDISDGKDVDSWLVLPGTETSTTPHDFGDIFRKTFDNSFINGSSQTRMFIDNGKKRIESVQKNEQGLTQKTILYEIGNLRYSVIIVTDKSGKVVKREKNFNFLEEELPNFKKQWSSNFQSDFED